jgi:acyl-CoA reductase-like NAD-dependent aldehyde dehydrogenase
VQDAIGKGGVVLTGGKKTADETGNGRFFEPTVIGRASQEMQLAKCRKIGPVVGVEAVDSPSMARKIINSQLYGLNSYVFTQEPLTVDHLSSLLNVGTVYVNDIPLYGNDHLVQTGRKRSSKVFKGVNKEALLRYTRPKGIDITRL